MDKLEDMLSRPGHHRDWAFSTPIFAVVFNLVKRERAMIRINNRAVERFPKRSNQEGRARAAADVNFPRSKATHTL